MKHKIGEHEIEIDEADLPLLEAYQWTVRVGDKGKASVVRYETVEGKRHLRYLHKIICPSESPLRTYARDGNFLNVSRSNLYTASQAAGVVKKAAEREGTTQWPCPFSPNRLEELYWREQKTITEIGAMAVEIQGWGKQPSPGTVNRWLEQAHIRRRTDEEKGKIKARGWKKASAGMFSPQAKEKSAEASRKRHQPIILGAEIIAPARRGWKHTKAAKEKISQSKKGMVSTPADPDKTLHLTCPQCGKAFARFVSYQSYGDTHNAYCSTACAGDAKRKIETRPCSQCGNPITRQPSRFKKPVQFCDSHCTNVYNAKQRGDTRRGKPAHPAMWAAIERRAAEAKSKRTLFFCPICNAQIWLPAHEVRRIEERGVRPCCSTTCAGAYRRQRRLQDG